MVAAVVLLVEVECWVAQAAAEASSLLLVRAAAAAPAKTAVRAVRAAATRGMEGRMKAAGRAGWAMVVAAKEGERAEVVRSHRRVLEAVAAEGRSAEAAVPQAMAAAAASVREGR